MSRSGERLLPPPERLDPCILHQREDAEDECIRDFRRMIVHEGRGTLGAQEELELPCIRRTSSEPTPIQVLLHPEIGQARDVGQPGGFRRDHVRRSVRAPTYAQTILSQLMQQQFDLPNLAVPRDANIAMKEAGRETQESGGASRLTVTIMLVKLFWSIGFLIVPRGCKEAGFIGAPVCLVFFYILEINGMLQLIECTRVVAPGLQFEEIAGVAFGPWAYYLTKGAIILCQLGFACVALAAGATNLVKIVPDWTSTQRLWILLPFTVPLCCIRNLKYLAASNLASIAFCVIAMALLTNLALSRLWHMGQQPVPMVTAKKDWLLWLGVCPYLYEGINFVLPLFERMEDQASFSTLLIGTTLLLTVLYICFGCLFYLAFGEDTATMATLNAPEGSILEYILGAGIAVYAIVTMPNFFIVINRMYEPYAHWASDPRSRMWQQNCVRMVQPAFVVMLTWIGGDRLQHLIALVGGLCCTFLALVAPSLVHISLCKGHACRLRLNICVATFGLAVMVVTTTHTLATW